MGGALADEGKPYNHSMVESPHPTAVKLMDTVSTMLDSDNPHDILVDEVLRISGVSRGSLYHHFGDFPGLIHATLLRRFSQNVEADTRAMWNIAEHADSQESYWSKIRQLSAATQVPERAPIRAERARLVSLASSDDHFAQALAREQERLTQGISDAIALAQSKGWVKAELSPLAISVFLQAYSLGRAVDDISERRVPNDDWVTLIESVLTSFES